MWEVEKPMHSYCIIKCSVCLFGTQSYLPTHLAYKLDVAKLSTASLRCSSKFNNCKYKATVLSNSALVFIGASVRFYWSLHWLQICHWILESGALNKFLEISEKRMWRTMWSLNCLPGVMCMNPDIWHIAGLILTVPQFIRKPSHNGAFLLSRPKMYVRNAAIDNRVVQKWLQNLCTVKDHGLSYFCTFGNWLGNWLWHLLELLEAQ